MEQRKRENRIYTRTPAEWRRCNIHLEQGAITELVFDMGSTDTVVALCADCALSTATAVLAARIESS